MRIIHTRKRVFETDYAFQNKMTLLVWVLSILKWKEYGNQVVLYCDNITLNKIKEFGFEHLYDEINTDLMEQEHKGIDFYCYWAMPKLLALRHEVLTLGNDCVIADQDVVPMQDVKRLWNNCDVAVWSNKEFVEFRSIYPELYELSLPRNYKLPEWFTGTAKPLNTGIIHIRDKSIVDLFTSEAIKMATDNHNEHKNTTCQTMCNAEQRLLGEIVRHKKLVYGVMQPVNEGLFNRNGFHTHGYKNKLNNDNSLSYNVKLLNMIKDLNYPMYLKLINNEWFKEELEHRDQKFNVKEFLIYEK